MTRLNQVLAKERDIKGTATRRVTETHKLCQKPSLFDGLIQTYRPAVEGEPEQPPKRTRVQLTVDETIKQITEEFGAWIDITASKDLANCNAKADVCIDGSPLLENVPATHLLWLEKRVREIRKFVEELPILDSAYDWQQDEHDGLFKADGGEVVSTKKVQKALVLHPPTKEHPAQTEKISEDVIVGYRRTSRHSGAIPSTRKEVLLRRTDELLQAVVTAREEANQVEASPTNFGKKVLGHIFF